MTKTSPDLGNISPEEARTALVDCTGDVQEAAKKCAKERKKKVVQTTHPIYYCTFNISFQSINPILIQVYPRKRRWPNLPHSNSNLSNSHSPSGSIHGILLLQTNTLALLLDLHLPRLLWSSSLPLALHFKLQCSPFSKHAHHPSSKHAHHPSSTHARTNSLSQNAPQLNIFLPKILKITY